MISQSDILALSFDGLRVVIENLFLIDSYILACKKAGIACGQRVENGITMHDFRRTFKTNMLKAGIDKVYRDIIVGHSCYLY